MSFYRKYRAAYTFDQRSDTELSMTAGDILVVGRNADGTWPPPEKWMQGYNERSGERGEFPGGAYVEFVDEFHVEEEKIEEKSEEEPPPPPPPRRTGNSRAAVQENHIGGGGGGGVVSKSPGPPPTIPKPAARKQRKSVEVASKRHTWTNVTFRIPVQCSGCELQEELEY